jgi:hypothetical protein
MVVFENDDRRLFILARIDQFGLDEYLRQMQLIRCDLVVAMVAEQLGLDKLQ